MGAIEKANAPGQGGASRNRTAVDDGNHTKSPDARNRYRIGSWPEHLALLFDRLTGNEVKRFLRFKLDYLYNDGDGLPNDGKALPRALADFSDRRRSFQTDRGRDFSVIVDDCGHARARWQSYRKSSTITLKRGRRRRWPGSRVPSSSMPSCASIRP